MARRLRTLANRPETLANESLAKRPDTFETWLRSFTCDAYILQPMGTAFSEVRMITLRLPTCGKNMKIQACQTKDCNSYSWKPSGQNIHEKCGNLDVTCFPGSLTDDDCMQWEKAVKAIKPTVELLQKELGENDPAITAGFFLWLCFFFPYKSDLVDESRLRFRDASGKAKPSQITVDFAIAD